MISKECGLGAFLFGVVAVGEAEGSGDSSYAIRRTLRQSLMR
ncbi:hypothetical protein [Pectobacterium brasiliense]|nr:hypothetical protein [Pectobacterium brasiliense]